MTGLTGVTGVEVLARLAAADPWSFTVYDTLTRKLGHGEIVGVTRIKSWRIDFDLGPEDAMASAARLLEETALLANPNRDRWSVRLAEDGSRGGPRGGAPGQRIWRKQPDARSAMVVRVSDVDDPVGRSVARVLRTRLGMGEVRDVGFSWVWVLETSVGPDRARRIAADVAVSRSWRRGLLSNPHYQRAEVVAAEEYLAEGEV
jgi:phosphoribosylformylglycinamidine (FGAM) synthase PurS component